MSDEELREIGRVISNERAIRDLSAEQAARQGGIAYATWQRVESGKPVRKMTWNGVDRTFDLPPGTTIAFAESGDLEAYRQQLADSRGAGSGTATASAVTSMGAGTAIAPDGTVARVAGPGDDLDERLLGLNLEQLRRLADKAQAVIRMLEYMETSDGER